MRPTAEAELGEAIADLASRGGRARLRGGGSRDAFGAPVDAAVIDMTGFAGVVDYDPAELVLTVRPGIPLADVEALVAASDQMLAFDPFDHGTGAATIGGVVAGGVAGSLRLSGGGVRDHLLGFRGVSGRGEAFKAGAKVVKNVTGYDLPKLAAGSWGRLFALTEITLKTMPRPPVTATRAVAGLEPAAAVRLMAAAMGSQAEVAAAAHRPAGDGEPALTVLRLAGFGPSVRARAAMLEALLADHGTAIALDGEEDARIWDGLRTLAALPAEPPLWRVNVPPSGAPALIDALAPLGARWLMDWAGGLVWIAWDGEPDRVRAAALASSGHATLVRAPAAMRAAVPAFHPPRPGVAALEARVRRAFDPAGVFETGRF